MVHDQLSFGIGGLIAFNGHTEIVEGLAILQIDIGTHVGQLFGEGAVEQAVFLGGVEILAVDPNHVNGAGFGICLFFTGELCKDIVDIHANHFQCNVVLLLYIVSYGGVQPVVAVFVASPTVKCDGGATRGLRDLLPLRRSKVERTVLFAARRQSEQQGSTQDQGSKLFEFHVVTSFVFCYMPPLVWGAKPILSLQMKKSQYSQSGMTIIYILVWFHTK